MGLLTALGWGTMFEDLKNGFINAVAVWHLDRLHRQPRELEDFFQPMGVRELATATGRG